jgi:hypothetical protein
LKMCSVYGASRDTMVADIQMLYCMYKSIPSSKAWPLKLWLAKVSYKRV